MTFPGVDTLDTYGGRLRNYDDEGVVDPETDRDAEAVNKAFGSLAAMTHNAIRAYCVFAPRIDGADVLEHDAAWGNAAALAPSVVRIDLGVFDVQWPAIVPDGLGELGPLKLRRASPSVEGERAIVATTTVTASNAVRVRIFEGVQASDATGMRLVVLAW